jgi:hypothetical protein
VSPLLGDLPCCFGFVEMIAIGFDPRLEIMPTTWTCPECDGSFARKGQRHACGTGDRSQVLRNRPPSVIAVYEAVESFAESLGPIEIAVLICAF